MHTTVTRIGNGWRIASEEIIDTALSVFRAKTPGYEDARFRFESKGKEDGKYLYEVTADREMPPKVEIEIALALSVEVKGDEIFSDEMQPPAIHANAFRLGWSSEGILIDAGSVPIGLEPERYVGKVRLASRMILPLKSAKDLYGLLGKAIAALEAKSDEH